MAPHYQTRQTFSEIAQRYSAGRLMLFILPELLLRIITFFHRWATRSLSSTSISMMKSESDMMSAFLQKRRTHLWILYRTYTTDCKHVYFEKENTSDSLIPAFVEKKICFCHKTAGLSVYTWNSNPMSWSVSSHLGILKLVLKFSAWRN